MIKMLPAGSTRPNVHRTGLFVILTIATAVVLIFIATYPTRIRWGAFFGPSQQSTGSSSLVADASERIIGSLSRDADAELESIIETETYSQADAAQAYRRRRRRHPPPGFDLWYDFAKQQNVTVIESFFDQIYEDLEPFWSISPQDLRSFAGTWSTVLSVRNNTVDVRMPLPAIWMVAWKNMMDNMPQIPDIDMAFMAGDEPRVVVPFEAINEHMKAAEQNRIAHNQVSLTAMRREFQKYPPMTTETPTEFPADGIERFEGGGLWDHIVKACRPDDPARQHPASVPGATVPPVHSNTYTAGSVMGYVSNVTMARNVCHNPNLRTLHGYLISPMNKTIYTKLQPVFTVNKLVGVGNDILVPPPTHWIGGTYAGSDHTSPWESKINASIWRGVATGGLHTASNWWGFHRHRMVHVMNGTLQSLIEDELRASDLSTPSIQAIQAAHPTTFDQGIHNIPFPLPHLYNLAAQSYGKLGRWVSKIANAGFINQHCDPLSYFQHIKTCNHTDQYYGVVDWMNITEIMSYKYLPDIDGHTASGRFPGFLRSLSVPIKSSIFAEWHDRRLIPWRHYVPLSGEFQEWWALMQYFLGYQAETPDEISVPDHDGMGERIGRQGSEWSHHVERRENLLVYFYRVIIEYARICADDRIEMGFIDDLL